MTEGGCAVIRQPDYVAGRDAYRQGETINPHPEGSQEYKLWRMGWLDSYTKAKEQDK
jgi:hypothetical protein